MQTQKKNYVYPMTTVVAAYAATLMANSGSGNNVVNIYDTESQDDDQKKLSYGTANKGSDLTLESKGNGNAWDTWDE